MKGFPACAKASAGRRNPAVGAIHELPLQDVRRNKPAPRFDTGKDEDNAADGRFSAAC